MAGFKELRQLIRQDEDYAWSWHCNIAMAFVDEMSTYTVDGLSQDLIHEAANNAAKNFMKTCFDVDIDWRKYSE